MKFQNHKLTKWLKYILSISVVFILCSGIIFVAVNWFVFTTATPCDMDFPTAFLDKKKLLETSQSPRLILVGDSGLAFGINSEKLSNELNIETINLGVTTILTGRFTMESTKPYINRGDIVVLSLAIPQWADTPQYGESQFDKPGGFDWLWKILVLDPSEISHITTIQQVEDVIGSNLKELSNRLNPEKSEKLGICTDKRRLGFNEYGDFVAWIDRPNPNKDFSEHDLGEIDIPDSTFVYINDYATYVKSKGATIYYLPTVLSKTVYNNNQSALDRFENSLTTNLTIPILSDFQDFIFDDKYIFDAIFHTTGEGREIYTAMIVRLLDQKLNTD